MNMRISNIFESTSNYFERLPEKLVLEGYRHWTAGFETGSVIPWEMAWTLFTQELGTHHAKPVLAELSHFIRTLHFGASCRLQAFPFGSMHICREECLVMGLISALQNDDETTLGSCLSALVSASRRFEVEAAARDYASSLSLIGQHLLPVPHYAIATLLPTINDLTVH